MSNGVVSVNKFIVISNVKLDFKRSITGAVSRTGVVFFYEIHGIVSDIPKVIVNFNSLTHSNPEIAFQKTTKLL